MFGPPGTPQVYAEPLYGDYPPGDVEPWPWWIPQLPVILSANWDDPVAKWDDSSYNWNGNYLG
jgi:hypothetical protein